MNPPSNRVIIFDILKALETLNRLLDTTDSSLEPTDRYVYRLINMKRSIWIREDDGTYSKSALLNGKTKRETLAKINREIRFCEGLS